MVQAIAWHGRSVFNFVVCKCWVFGTSWTDSRSTADLPEWFAMDLCCQWHPSILISKGASYKKYSFSISSVSTGCVLKDYPALGSKHSPTYMISTMWAQSTHICLSVCTQTLHGSSVLTASDFKPPFFPRLTWHGAGFGGVYFEGGDGDEGGDGGAGGGTGWGGRLGSQMKTCHSGPIKT